MKKIRKDNTVIAVLDDETKICSTSELLDIFATLSYNEGCDSIGIVVQKTSLPEEFFDLKTGIAGEMLQKFSNYGVKLAIVGDFGAEKSQSLLAFIRECNRGRQIFFCYDTEKAVDRLQK